MMPVNRSTYVLSVSRRSMRGLDFFGLPSNEGDGGAELEALDGVVGVKGIFRPWKGKNTGVRVSEVTICAIANLRIGTSIESTERWQVSNLGRTCVLGIG
jgi:hypothetical protein